MYDVALLIERQLEPLDADQVIALHEGLDDQVTYHVLLPVENSSHVMAASLGALGGGQVLPVGAAEDLAEIQHESVETGQRDVDASAELLRARGQIAHPHLTEDDAVEALVTLVAEAGCAEAIILTEPHLVAELLRIDWSSRAKRKLDVPTLHLLEHVPFDAQR